MKQNSKAAIRLGLIGMPLGHSWSPAIHSFFLHDDVYDLYELQPSQLQEFAAERRLDGFNVTIPYKQQIMQYLDACDPAAEAIGAVNTVVKRDGKLIGYNTDYLGLKQLLEGNGIAVNGRRICVLGSGGASKAAVRAVTELGGTPVVVSRHPGSGEISYDELKQQEAEFTVLINTTPVGMFPSVNYVPVDLAWFSRLEAVVDVVANPLRTSLCYEAKLKGIPSFGGFEMLVRQALEADRLFTGNPMEDASVHACMDALLKERKGIALIGMPTSGKSTIAKLLGEALEKPVMEMDAELEKRLGTSIAQCFADHGEAYFRDAESALADELSGYEGIISCGGGLILRKENMTAISHNSLIFWIDRNLDLLYGSDDRPLSRSREDLMRLYGERKDRYALYSDYRIENNSTAEEAAAKILAIWNGRKEA